jgi:hypothetical protein
MSGIDRLNAFPKLKELVASIMELRKASLRMCAMIELLNEWFLVENSQGTNALRVNGSFNMSGSFNSSLSNSDPRINNLLTDM